MRYPKKHHTKTIRKMFSRNRRHSSTQKNTSASYAKNAETSLYVEYDVVIIGGGIGGLYTAYSLLKRQPMLRILIVEKQPYLGGRIYTYHDSNMTVETGAGRFSNHHKRLLQLIEDCGLSKHIVSIKGGFSYIPISRNKTKTLPISDGPEDDIREIMDASKTIHIDTLRNMSFIHFAKQVVGDTRAKHICDSFGYFSELVIMNAYDAIQLMRVLDTQSKQNQFYSLSGGLSQIISKLETNIRSHSNAHILVDTQVTDVLEEGNAYRCIVDKNDKKNKKGIAGYSIITKQCVFAVPKQALEKIPLFQPITPLLRQVSCGSLCRIYSHFENKEWMQNLDKITTNNDLRMIIPIDPQKGVIMISYTDNVFADTWHSLYIKKGVDAVNSRISKKIRETLHIDIPTPTHTKVFYWSCGVGYWNVGANSKLVSKKMIQPFPHKRIFVCGEHFSEKHQQWMEGALETSETVVRKIIGTH